MNSLQDTDLNNKRVLVRCDFNVPMKDGKILDDFRIQKILPTLSVLKRKRAEIVLLSHLGQPGGNKNQKLSLEPLASRLEELLREEVKFSPRCVGRRVKRAVKKLKAGEILLLENLRFEKGEEANDEGFARALASLGDVYVNEAFSVCHRKHASIIGLPKFLPHFLGPELEREIRVLTRLSQNPERPLIVIMGGVKVAPKMEVIERFLKLADHLLIGGQIANVILRVKGICIGKPWPEESIVNRIKKLNLTDPKVHLPIDALASPDETGEIYIRETGPGNVRKEEEIFDIGKETIEKFGEIIKDSRTIFWSGPLGLAENEKFARGTEGVARAIIRNYAAFKVVGGGDTIAILRKFDLLDKFSFVSTGGGAMLAFLAGEKLPGIEALR